MRRPCLAAVLVCAMGLISACQGPLPGKAPDAVTPNAVAGDPIEVMALDAPGTPDAAAAPPDGAAAEPAGPETAVPQGAPGTATEAAKAEAVAAPVAAPAPKPDLAATPVTPKSEQQVACEKKKGRWVKVGKAGLQACVFATKDAGKSCERESQCESVCLARSRTCAPFKPLYGCNDILQDNGARVTLCLD